MSSPSISHAAVRARPRLVARALAGDGDPVQGALEVVRTTTDAKRAEAEVRRMEAALADARRRGEPIAERYADMVREAQDRVVALRLLSGLPDLPRAAVARNPDNSFDRSPLSQAARARALMAGYEGETGLRKLLPWFFKREVTPAFDKLDAEAKRLYLAIAKEADAAGQIALHDLLVAGRLPGPLLGELHRLASAPADKAVDRRQLVSQTLVELFDPLTITQASRGTCAATSIQMLIALTKPALYVELARSLASPAGKARLPGGAELVREPDWAYANDGGRSIPSRLLQPALMELGNGELDYLNDLDADRDLKTGRTQVSGLEASQAREVLTQLGASQAGYELLSPTYAPDLSADTARALDNNLSGPRDWLMLVQNPALIDPATQDALLERLRATATPDRPVYATIVYAPDAKLARTVFHAVLVTEVKDGRVRYMNPWGQAEAISERDFKRSVVNVLAGPPVP